MAKKPHKYRDDVTNTAEQQALFLSSERRAQRLAQQLGELQEPRQPLGGRVRRQLVGVELLPLEFSRTISAENVTTLGLALHGKQPLFDQFTDHNHVSPNTDSIDKFIMAGNKNNKRLKTEKDPEKRKLIKANMQRQTQIEADRLEQGIFDDLNTARRRRASLHVVRAQIKTGVTPDEQAMIHATDAVVDFGNCLAYNPKVLRQMGSEHLAETVIFIGQTAERDPSILSDNTNLLGLVHAEQVTRCDYWQPIFDAVKAHLTDPATGKDRLTITDVQNGIKLEQELQRLQGLMPSESATQ